MTFSRLFYVFTEGVENLESIIVFSFTFWKHNILVYINQLKRHTKRT